MTRRPFYRRLGDSWRHLFRSTPLPTEAKPRRHTAAVLDPRTAHGDRDDKVDDHSVVYRPYSTDDDVMVQSNEQRRIQELALSLYYENPLMRNMHTVTKSYTVGHSELKIKAADNQVQKVLDRFAEDPLNTMVNNPGLDAIRLRLFGESAYVAEILPTGLVRFHWWHPYRVRKVRFWQQNDTYPTNVLLNRSRRYEEAKVRLVPTSEPGEPRREELTKSTYDGHLVGEDGDSAWWPVIALRDRKHSTRGAFDMALVARGDQQLLDGLVLYWRVNWEGTSRGAPDYVDVFEEMSRYKQMRTEEALRVQMLKDYVWVYSHKGEPSPELRKMMNEGWQPEAGMCVFLDSDTTSFDAKTPSINAAETDTFFRGQKTDIITSSNLPPTWVSEDQANRASAVAQELPTSRVLEQKQATYRKMVELACRFQIDTAIYMGILDPKVDRTFEVIMPPVRTDDVAKQVAMVTQLGSTVAKMAEDGLIQREVGAVVVQDALTNSGVTSTARMLSALKLPPKDKVPVPDPKPTAALSSALAALQTVLAGAVQNGLMDRRIAARILQNVLTDSGITTLNEMLDALGKEEGDEIPPPPEPTMDDAMMQLSGDSAQTRVIPKNVSQAEEAVLNLLRRNPEALAKFLPEVRVLEDVGVEA